VKKLAAFMTSSCRLIGFFSIGEKKISIKALFYFCVLFSFFCLFWSLSRYSLWDDESATALHAEVVYKTGDTGALLGNNLIAFRGGLVLRDLKDRSVSPLQYFIAAPFVGNFPGSSAVARLPFALTGFLVFLILLTVGAREISSNLAYLTYCICITGNLALVLYFRQCRYYSLVALLFVLILLLYKWWLLRGKGLRLLCVASFLLFASHTMIAAAVLVALLCDYLLFGVHQRKLVLADLLKALIFFLTPACLVLYIWNPFATSFGSYVTKNTFMNKVTLIFWVIRDLDRGFLISIPVLFMSSILFVKARDTWLLRALIMFSLLVIIISMVSPQIISITEVADIRYYLPAVLVALPIQSYALYKFLHKTPFLLIALTFFVFWTNLFHVNSLSKEGIRMPFCEFLKEMGSSGGDPYGSVSSWLRHNVPLGSTVFVLPDYAAYPLMFHAPHSIYAWQLDPDRKSDPQFNRLPDIHFKGLVLPDYVIAFGPVVSQIRDLLQQWAAQGVRYREEARLMTYWKDLYRPEIFWRTFEPIEKYDPNTEAIYIYKREL